MSTLLQVSWELGLTLRSACRRRKEAPCSSPP